MGARARSDACTARAPGMEGVMCRVGDVGYQGHGGVAEDIYYVQREGEPLFIQWFYACIPSYIGHLVKGHTGSLAGESSLQNARPMRPSTPSNSFARCISITLL